MKDTQKFRGRVRKLFFCNPESLFAAGVLETTDGEIRFSGRCAPSVGDLIEIEGRWTEHSKFGRQVQVEDATVVMDESPDALALLLARDGRFKGIGEIRAARIVQSAVELRPGESFGDALLHATDEIAASARCPVDLVRAAAEIWSSQREHFDALSALAEQGWSGAQSQSIVLLLGSHAPALVRSDPYALIGRIPRFGFKTVDAVALKLGLDPSSTSRLSAGLAYCLDRAMQDGDTWISRVGLVLDAAGELRPDTLGAEDAIGTALDGLVTSGLVYQDESPLGETIVADARMVEAECEVYGRLVAGLKDRIPVSADSSLVDTSLNDGQARAVRGSVFSRFSLICGGAGVGKTYAMRAICEMASHRGDRIGLCAPTGKAARRLEHSAGMSASTIHRILEPQFDRASGRFRFERGVSNPLDFDLVVVDEFSMVDVRLLRSLLLALPERSRLLLVGDHHQIPSVSPGAILRDLLSGSAGYQDSVHVLTEIVRQAGVLARNTSAILDGVVVREDDECWRLHYLERGREEHAAALVAMQVEAEVTGPARPPFGRQLDLAWDVQVLSPMRKGPLGTWILNRKIQEVRQRLLGNEPPPRVEKEDEAPRPLVGDRVIWTWNDYELGLSNGTQAIVLGFGKGGSMALFVEDGRQVDIPGEKRKHVEVAYAMTMHKAQGSEWPMVVLVASTSHHIMHDRNLLYTGAARASEGLLIIGDRGGIARFASERQTSRRRTLGSFLVHGWTPRTLPVVGGDARYATEPVDK